MSPKLFLECVWSQHWTNGGTGITKFESPERIKLFEHYVAEFGDKDIFMQNGELHTTKPIHNGFLDISDFWEFVRSKQN